MSLHNDASLTHGPGRIVVGWAGSAEGRSALAWAVQQALLTARSVVVLHDVQQDSLGGGAGEQNGDRSIQAVRSQIDAAVHLMAHDYQDLDLQIAVEVDDPAAGLVRWSALADIVAVGSPATRHPRMMGSLPEHVAAAADAPVAWIPAGWCPSANADRTVVVGATSTPAGRTAVQFAADEAVRMHATLVAVVGAGRLTTDGRTILARFDDLAIDRPGLTVEVDWVDSDPGQALVDRSRTAQLVVVGSHHSTDRWSIRLGPVTELVLRRAVCPVLTVARLHRPVPSPVGSDGPSVRGNSGTVARP